MFKYFKAVQGEFDGRIINISVNSEILRVIFNIIE